MYVSETIVEKKFTRKSKNGCCHSYLRKQRIVNLKCDNCGEMFARPRGSMDPKRLSNNYFHVCNKCNAKQFAQKRSIEKNNTWKLTASSALPIGRL
jgi:formylmethanofuran dehydrogenase subunit E